MMVVVWPLHCSIEQFPILVVNQLRIMWAAAEMEDGRYKALYEEYMREEAIFFLSVCCSIFFVPIKISWFCVIPV